MAWFNQFQHLWGGGNQPSPQGPQFSQPQRPQLPSGGGGLRPYDPAIDDRPILETPQNRPSGSSLFGPLSNPMDTGLARKATPAEIQAGGYVPPQQSQAPGWDPTLPPEPTGWKKGITGTSFEPIYGPPTPAQQYAAGPVGPAQGALTGGMSGPAGMMGGMFGGNPSGSGPLKSIWEASPQGMTAPNQPYRPFTGQPQQPQQNSRFGMPQQSNAGSGSGYRRMRAPNGEERDIPESQGQHFLSRGGRWV